MEKFLRIGLSLCLTAFVSFLLFIYLFMYYDELHIKSTDYQLKDNLTHFQVVFDITKTILAVSVLTSLTAIGIYILNHNKNIPRFGKKVAAWCWCFMFAIVMCLSVYHYRETSTRMKNERQWRIQNQRID